MLGCGEMGICNTTTSSAVLCALTGAEPEETVGRGAGITDEQLAKKLEIVRTALEINPIDPDNTLDVISGAGWL